MLIDNPRAVCKNTTPGVDRAGDREHRLMSSSGPIVTIQESVYRIREVGEISDGEIADGPENTLR
jgi:hypothetical protein